MVSAVDALMTGSKTIQEVLADMFKAIGQAFIKMAAEIIAKQLVMIALQSILKALGGGLGGGASSVPSSAYGDLSVAGPDFFSGGMIPGYSTGGFVGPNRVAMVGEQGPELIQAGPTGATVTSNPQSEAALNKYGPGNEAMAQASGSMDATINYNGPTLNFNGDDYIPRSEIPQLIAAGAKQGESRTLNALRNKRSARSRIGI